MTSAGEVRAALARERTSDKRILTFGALLAREIDSEVTVVGGSAIEVHTGGEYVSGDIGIRANRLRVAAVLRHWGFRNPSRLWINDDWKIAVDVVGDLYSGDPYRTATVMTDFGPVGVAVPEDLIVKRLARAKHWRGSDGDKREDLVQARLLWERYRSTLDVAYLEDRAGHYEVEDLLEKLREHKGD